jgi:hypothetical protein
LKSREKLMATDNEIPAPEDYAASDRVTYARAHPDEYREMLEAGIEICSGCGGLYGLHGDCWSNRPKAAK